MNAPTTPYKDFKMIAKDWDLSPYTFNRMKQAYNSGEKFATVDVEKMTRQDVRFLSSHGWTIKPNGEIEI